MDCYQASDVTDRAKACLLPSPSLLPPPPPSAHNDDSHPSAGPGSYANTSSGSGSSPCPGANHGLKLSHFEEVLRSPRVRGIEVESLAVPSTEVDGHSKVGLGY